jgi:hypothetical protein
MARLTKKAIVENKFNDYLEEKNITLYSDKDPFDHCWNQVKYALLKKLNSQEIFDYIRIHILPALTNPRLPMPGYKEIIQRNDVRRLDITA